MQKMYFLDVCKSFYINLLARDFYHPHQFFNLEFFTPAFRLLSKNRVQKN